MMKVIMLIFALAVGGICFAGESSTNLPTGLAIKVHGRLCVYCGTPSCRIWVAGTKRILGVAETDPSETALMPSKLSALLTTQNVIFGDFTAVPLTKDEEGVMRIVKVVAAENLVITDGQLQFIRRVQGKIGEELNQPLQPTRAFVPHG